jgi:predicted dehydrogenase
MGVRAAVIGLGHMGRNHARVLGSGAVDGVELVAAMDTQGDRFGAAKYVPTVDSVEALLDIGIDYAVISVPTFAHEQVAVALAQAGVHTLIEKPLAPTAESARAIRDAFAGTDLVAGVGHVERFNPALRQMRARIAAGELGAVFQISTRRQGPFPARIADVGVVADLAAHDIDLTAWLTDSKYVSVSAHTAHKSGRAHEDLIAGIGVLANGVVTNHLVNWLSPFKERSTIVLGEKGMLVADTLTADLTLHRNGTIESEWEALGVFRGVTEGDSIRYAFHKPEPLLVEHEAMRDAIAGKSSDIVGLDEGTRTVAVVEGMLTSAREDRTVHLSESTL